MVPNIFSLFVLIIYINGKRNKLSSDKKIASEIWIIKHIPTANKLIHLILIHVYYYVKYKC